MNCTSEVLEIQHQQKSNEVFLIPATNGNKRRNLMQNKILYYRSLPSVTDIREYTYEINTGLSWIRLYLSSHGFADLCITFGTQEVGANKTIRIEVNLKIFGLIWNVMPHIRRVSNFYFFAALYCSCLGFNALLASLRYKGLQ